MHRRHQRRPGRGRQAARRRLRLGVDAIDGVGPRGVRTADGRLHGPDCIVAATGLRAYRVLRPIEVVGPGGMSLHEVLVERASAYLAVALFASPNLFMPNGPNGPVDKLSLIEDRGVPTAWPWSFTKFRQAMAAPDLSAYELIR